MGLSETSIGAKAPSSFCAGEGLHKNCGIEPIFYLGNEARFRACRWRGQPLRGCAVAGVLAVLAGGFSGALGGAQPGAQGRAWSLRGGRLRGVFKPFHGASSLMGNAGGSCQCFSQQMPPAETSSIAARSIAAAGFQLFLKRRA